MHRRIGMEAKRCSRCHGLMVVETFYDCGHNQLTYDCFEGWRCISCGHVWDQAMATNRAYAGKPSASHNRRRSFPVRGI